jgi:hypothetical protein
MFGKPDTLVEELRDQIAWLRGQVEKLQAENLALKDSQAFRLTHPNEQVKEPGVAWEDPRSDLRPRYSEGEIRETFGS